MSALKQVILDACEFVISGDPADPYFSAIQAHAGHNDLLHAFTRHHLAADAICLDVGANIGLTALMLSSACPKGHVYAVEAGQINYGYLQANVELNGLQAHVTPIACAVGAQSGALHVAEFGASSYVISDPAAAVAGTEAEMRTIDDIVSALALDRIGLIKLDVEGFEPAALAGAKETIERYSPWVFMEFNSWCLAFYHEFSTRAFATAIWGAFDVLSVALDGSLSPAAGGDPVRFLHENAVMHGCVDDVLLRLKPGASVPTFHAMTDNWQTARLRAELEQLKAH